MKRIVCPVLALSLLLSGCDMVKENLSVLFESKMPQVEVELPSETPVPAEADYDIQRQDESIYDGSGELLVEYYYDLVQLTGDRPEVTSINQSLEADSEVFFTSNGGRSELKEMAFSMPDFGPYFNTAEAEVVQNGDDLFSIRMTTGWYMGGVVNYDCYGLTYRLDTGEKLDLADLTDQDLEVFGRQVRDAVKDYMEKHSEISWWENAAQVVDEIPLEQMRFWVEDGEIVVSYATYDLAAGAYGAPIIPTGLTAKLT